MSNTPHILGIFNQKGGVGKSLVSSIIAEYASIIGKKNVLLIDLDMQCNSSDLWVGMEDSPNSQGGQLPPKHPDYDGDDEINERSTIADIFFGKAVVPFETYISEANGFDNYVEVMVGHPSLLERINGEFANESGQVEAKVINRLKEFLDMPELGDLYDLIILDTGPSRNPVFRSAIRASSHMIIPFECEQKSLQGINAMLQVYQSENYTRSEDEKLKIVGLLPNKVRVSTNIHRTTLELLHNKLGKVMMPDDVYLSLSSAFPDRDLKGVNPRSIFQISKSHSAYKQSYIVGEYVMNKIFG